MNTHGSPRTRHAGVTLIEMTLVIFLLIALMSTGMFFSGRIADWRAGREASETLRAVYAAQRLYLSDNPTTTVSSLTEALLLPYLPNRPATFPTITSLTNSTLTVRVNVSPPTINNGSGGSYDPSGNTRDSLWDVGE